MCRGKGTIIEDDGEGGRVGVPCDCTYYEVPDDTEDEDDEEE
jgi:hypothetical protein